MAKDNKVQAAVKAAPEKVETATKSTGKPSAPTYTYVGGGADSPRIINFMGMQTFVRGKETEVTNPAVLRKLPGHPCFVEGAIESEELHEYDEKAAAAEKAQKEEDARINAAYLKKHGKE